MRTKSSRAALLLLCAGAFVSSQEGRAEGTQVIIARPTRHAVVIDGSLGPAEWSAAIPVHVKANHRAEPPGLVPPGISPPDNQNDSSFKILAQYDADNLYLAVDVADDVLFHDGPEPWFDDDVEIFVDGDRQPGDLEAGVAFGDPNLEGFQLITTVGNERLTEPDNLATIVWESVAGYRPRGYVVEIKIPLDSINTHDTSPRTGGTPGFRRPGPGDTLGFNVAVGDDDTGGGSYDYPNGYISWAGSFSNWYVFDETAWGSLYLAPDRGHGHQP